MPTYEYRCRTCDHRFDIQQSISDDALTECPECAGDLRKVFHPVGIAFKGQGFYKNDARSDSGGGSRSSAGGSSATTTSGGDGESSAAGSDTGTPSGAADSNGTKTDRTAGTDATGTSDVAAKTDKTGKAAGATKVVPSGSPA